MNGAINDHSAAVRLLAISATLDVRRAFRTISFEVHPENVRRTHC